MKGRTTKRLVGPVGILMVETHHGDLPEDVVDEFWRRVWFSGNNPQGFRSGINSPMHAIVNHSEVLVVCSDDLFVGILVLESLTPMIVICYS